MSAAGHELPDLSLSELSEQIRSRSVSSVEATRACLERIERLDPLLNSFITVTAESALEQARHRDAERAAGSLRGPLHGVPIALKDLILTRGIRTTSGSDVLRDWLPPYSATVADRLEAAGAVLLGKLNMHEFAFGATSINPHYGPVRNPHDPTRITGGSSGGSAAAVAAGLCYGALGSDTGGSIRCPAALCGIVGLKPTYGRVSRYGVLPLAWSLDHVGPMTRTVRDAALMLQAMAGADPLDDTASSEPVPDYAAEVDAGVQGLRIGVPVEFFWHPVDPRVRERVLAGIELLARAGAEIREISLSTLDMARAAQTLTIYAEAAAAHRAMLRESSHRYGPTVRVRFACGLFVSGPDYLAAQQARRLVRRELARRFDEVDLIATPACPIPATRIDQKRVAVDGVEAPPQYFLVRNNGLFNLTGLPAVSVPCGLAGGLPAGLQLAGRPWEEGTVLRAARVVEQAVGPLKPQASENL